MEGWLENKCKSSGEMEQLTGSQQHELDSRADPSGRMVGVRLRRRAKRPLSLLALWALSLDGGGQWWHDMLANRGGRDGCILIPVPTVFRTLYSTIVEGLKYDLVWECGIFAGHVADAKTGTNHSSRESRCVYWQHYKVFLKG